MNSYEKAGWPGYRELETFPTINTPAKIPGLSETNHFQLRMACKVADKSEGGFRVILEVFLDIFKEGNRD